MRVRLAADTAPDVGSTDRQPSGLLRRRQILLLAVFTVVVEVLGMVDLLPGIRIGELHVPLSTIPAFGLALGCGARLVGRSSHRLVAVAYWALIAGVLPALLVVYVRDGRPGLWLSYVVAAFAEEFVYRLAIPMVLAIVLRAGGVRTTLARPAAFTIAAVWFVLLPGHREQMDQLSSAAPFLAYAVLAALIVYRSGSVLPMGAAHAVSNLLTALLWTGSTSANQRAVALVAVLVVLVLAYGRPRRLAVTDTGDLVDTGTGLEVVAVDLRAGAPVTATLSDGSVIDVEGGAGALREAVGSTGSERAGPGAAPAA